MCWKKTTFADPAFPLIEVTLGSSQTPLAYAGVYIKNKNKEGEYFKLGTTGFKTLSRTSTENGKKEAWAFKNNLGNYEYISISPTDYATYANPFRVGYGNSDLLVTESSKSASQYRHGQRYGIKTKTDGLFRDADIQDLNVLEIERETEREEIKPIEGIEDELTHEKFNFSNDIPTPNFKTTQNKDVLYTEAVDEVSIEWGKCPRVSGYRLEIFREEMGLYESTTHDLKGNHFSFSPSGGNYFFRVKCFIKREGKFIHGPYSENYKFTKLYPGGCPQENVTIHFSKYQDKHVYAKIDGTWYGTGYKYGEPRSIVNFPCPVKIEEYDFENEPNYIITNLGKKQSRIISSIDAKNMDRAEINKKYGNQLINQSTIISSKIKLPS